MARAPIPAPRPAAPEPPPAPVAIAPRAGRVRLASAGRDVLFDDDEPRDDDTARANWAVPWSDLMMTMFVVFAVLLVIQAAQHRAHQPPRPQQERPAPKGPEQRAGSGDQRQTLPGAAAPEAARGSEGAKSPAPQPPTEINVFERSQEAVRDADLRNAEIVLMADQSVKVSVQGPMFFTQGRADLRPEVTRFLDRLAQVIRQTPYEIHVVGHTDDVPINTPEFPSNWELSVIRASRVARHLMNSGGLEPGRFVVQGRGEYDPAKASPAEGDRAMNRRVEIIITRTVAGKAAQAGGAPP